MRRAYDGIDRCLQIIHLAPRDEGISCLVTRAENVKQKTLRPALPLLLIMPFAIGGCAAEFDRSGGFEGELQDAVLKAPNPTWQTYRAAVFLQLVSSVAAVDLKDPNSIGSFYLAAAAVNSDISNLAGHIYEQKQFYSWNVTGGNYPDGKTAIKMPKPYDMFYAPKNTPEPIKPCPNYSDKSCSEFSTDANQKAKNYFGDFEREIPILNDHLYGAAGSATRTDKM